MKQCTSEVISTRASCDTWDIFALQESFHEARLKVWKQHPDSFFRSGHHRSGRNSGRNPGRTQGRYEHQLERRVGPPAGLKTTGHPLVVTLANTRELLYLWNRLGQSTVSRTCLHLFRPQHRSVSLKRNTRTSGWRKNSSLSLVILPGRESKNGVRTQHLS